MKKYLTTNHKEPSKKVFIWKAQLHLTEIMTKHWTLVYLSISAVLCNKLNVRTVYCWWVPQNKTEAQKQIHMQ